jgi:hypothetical protein
MYEKQAALISLFLVAVCFLQFQVFCHQSQLLSSSTEVEKRFIDAQSTTEGPQTPSRTTVPVEDGSVALLVLAAIWR